MHQYNNLPSTTDLLLAFSQSDKQKGGKVIWFFHKLVIQMQVQLFLSYTHCIVFCSWHYAAKQCREVLSKDYEYLCSQFNDSYS